MTAREISTKVISDVLLHRVHLDKALNEHTAAISDKREKKLAQEICYGVMRWYHQLYFISKLLLKKIPKEKDSDILALVIMGLYQLKFLRIPDHAAISATVETTHLLGKPWAKNMVNAVLRKYQREKNSFEQRLEESLAATYSHPDWLIEKIKLQWPSNWQKILSSNNDYPPLHLRLNISKYPLKEYTHLLEDKGITYSTATHIKTGINLNKPIPVENIPGFLEGYISIQDFSAQLAIPLLDCSPGARVLDACAGPGGKTTHILEHTKNVEELVSVDISEERLKLVRDSLKRLGKTANIIKGDINTPSDWWDGKQFDRILLDAPCSASGVIRRHPDIKYNRTPGQILTLISLQNRLLASVWPLLKPKGKLLFSTCSILNEESDDQIAKFLKQHKNSEILPINAGWGVKSQFGRHTLPGYDEGDGFYYSIIVKKY